VIPVVELAIVAWKLSAIVCCPEGHRTQDSSANSPFTAFGNWLRKATGVIGGTIIRVPENSASPYWISEDWANAENEKRTRKSTEKNLGIMPPCVVNR